MCGLSGGIVAAPAGRSWRQMLPSLFQSLKARVRDTDATIKYQAAKHNATASQIRAGRSFAILPPVSPCRCLSKSIMKLPKGPELLQTTGRGPDTVP